VTAESLTILKILNQDRHIQDASGGSLYARDSASCPAWWADALETAEIYRKLEHNAQKRAQLSELPLPPSDKT
jgi:hypothetical protein